MARQPSNRPEADESDSQLDETGTPDDTAGADVDLESDESVPADVDRSLWEELRIEPVEIGLPSGTGYTLRAYRLSTDLTPTDVSERDEDDVFAARARQRDEEDEDEVVILDDQFADDEPDESADEEPGDEDEDDEEEVAEAEEVPVFLSHRGRLLLFKSPESLVSFVRSGAPNDLAQIDTWTELTERVQPADIVPLNEDSYELFLVVENLRGGHDVWDDTLLIQAGEVARDLGYALRLPAVLDMLAPGSSLDDLDEALRAAGNGGLSGFMGRRRLRKIGAQTASLGWRTIIGKISAVVDWRD